ncbi:membrane protein [Mycobacterium haemophilum]|uniref:Membrane protein n=1 Tax=Mycobacterium haemophilum TaxID=29311 RepID=A0A0I9TWK3_9MYCO|nr:membrane protein [Mycobacterium haemophilum]KLO38134.1 membrane protein [Mycobacterium haemophilum]KLO44456.1 membrane protein [Mycobacterium haemophilum]KLO49532.1 membrane protein [Mycobacterium haemophilum]
MVTRQGLVRLRWGAPLMVAAATTLVCATIWVSDPTTPNGPLPVCPTKALLGIDCPGCGSLRMLYSLMHGNLLAAARFNALGLAAVLLLVWTYLAWTYGRLVGRRIGSWQHHRWSAVVTLSLVVAWFVVRNIPFAPFTGLYV